MANIQILALCVVFGGVCAVYVSVVGFVLSALATVVILAGLNWAVTGTFAGWTLAGAFVALQGGYFLGVVGVALAGSVRSRIPKKTGERGAGLNADHE